MAMAIAPNKNNCSTAEISKIPAILIFSKGEEGTKTPMTLPILLAPKVYDPKCTDND